MGYSLRGPRGATFTMTLQWLRGETVVRKDTVLATTTGEWVSPTRTVTAPAGADHLFLTLTSENATPGYPYYLDGVHATASAVTVPRP